MKNRSDSLDALRGLAILLMVLAGSIAFGILPGWMYHAQEPPPSHIFNPDLPGITWVDLVFPFFLFSMGAAIPLAVYRRLERQESSWKVIQHIAYRYLMLVFFALFVTHSQASVMKAAAGLKENVLSIACFILLFLIYTNWKAFFSKSVAAILRYSGWGLALLFLYSYPFSGSGFSLERSDIIIMLLANMAFWGTLIWYFTRHAPLLRIGILPFIMAILLAGETAGSWNSWLYNWSPLSWMYNFYYLKYLFIVLPGTLAGEWLLERSSSNQATTFKYAGNTELFITLIIWMLLISNLVCLYNRWLLQNLIITGLLCSLLLLLVSKSSAYLGSLKKVSEAGVYLLMLGLFFEAYQGGIKKDISTYSYYFVSTGLAFLVLLSLILIEKSGYFKGVLRFLAANGRNPMIAYTTGNLLLLPLMKISGIQIWFVALSNHSVSGFLRGLIFTAVVALITIFCTRKNLFWKT